MYADRKPSLLFMGMPFSSRANTLLLAGGKKQILKFIDVFWHQTYDSPARQSWFEVCEHRENSKLLKCLERQNDTENPEFLLHTKHLMGIWNQNSFMMMIDLRQCIYFCFAWIALEDIMLNNPFMSMYIYACTYVYVCLSMNYTYFWVCGYEFTYWILLLRISKPIDHPGKLSFALPVEVEL